MENLRGAKIFLEKFKGYEKFSLFSGKHSNRVSELKKDRPLTHTYTHRNSLTWGLRAIFAYKFVNPELTWGLRATFAYYNSLTWGLRATFAYYNSLTWGLRDIFAY